jgi:DNA-binding transcriptional ArsR family regulator
MIPGADDDAVWRALSDPTRRAILDLLRERSRTTGDIAGHFEVTRYATMKHLTVLHEAGLIRIERRGRERLTHLNPTPIQRIYRRWIQPFEAAAADVVLRLQQHVEDQEDP